MCIGVNEATAEATIRTRWGARIAEHRRRRHLTQVELAVLSNRNPQTISRIERGEGLTLDTYIDVASYVDLDLVGER